MSQRELRINKQKTCIELITNIKADITSISTKFFYITAIVAVATKLLSELALITATITTKG
jgi:hypothetical protein